MRALPSVRTRILLSAFLAFHLLGILVAPNPNSFLASKLLPIYRPYLNVLGLASTWSFFAPEPFYHPMYIDYVVNFRHKMPVSSRFPDEQNPYFLRDRYNRRLSLTRIMLSSDGNMKNMFVHYLCGQFPEMESANLWRVVATEPSLEQVQKGEKKITDAADLKIEVLGTYYCPEATP
ncbi:MAG TPA: hypothetical protein VIH99_10790 [Bdellovibrionota bacterium]|jgi:hypothetical protein